MRRVQRRLPQPTLETPPRYELRLRPATPADTVRCALLDTTYATSYVWQLDTRREGGEVRICLRLVRLPRELTLIDEHRPPAFRNGTLRRGVLWLVAEEVEVDGWQERTGTPAPDTMRDAARPAAAAPWSHAVRHSTGASAVQLSLPEVPDQLFVLGGAPPDDEGGSPTAPPVARTPVSRQSLVPDWARLPAADGPAPTPAGWNDPSSGQVPTPAPPRAERRPANVVGHVAAAITAGDSCAYLQALAVQRAYRRRGIAGQLLTQARRWAAKAGATRLMADVSAHNYPTLRLLEKAGFTFCGYNDRCYPKDEVAVFFSVGL